MFLTLYINFQKQKNTSWLSVGLISCICKICSHKEIVTIQAQTNVLLNEANYTLPTWDGTGGRGGFFWDNQECRWIESLRGGSNGGCESQWPPDTELPCWFTDTAWRCSADFGGRAGGFKLSEPLLGGGWISSAWLLSGLSRYLPQHEKVPPFLFTVGYSMTLDELCMLPVFFSRLSTMLTHVLSSSP